MTNRSVDDPFAIVKIQEWGKAIPPFPAPSAGQAVTSPYEGTPDDVVEPGVAHLLCAVRHLGTRRHVPKGVILFDRGDQARHYFIVISGVLEAFEPTGARRRLVRILSPGDFFILDGGEHHEFGCAASFDASVICCGRRRLGQMAGNDPVLAAQLRRAHERELEIMLACLGSRGRSFARHEAAAHPVQRGHAAKSALAGASVRPVRQPCQDNRREPEAPSWINVIAQSNGAIKRINQEERRVRE